MTKQPSPVPLLTIRRAGDLVEAIPYMLGFHPSSSLVLIGLTDARITVTARMDLDLLASTDSFEEIRAVFQNSGATSAVAAIYDDKPRSSDSELPFTSELADLGVDLCDIDVMLVDAILIANGRYYSFFCSEASCCPPDGRLLPGDTSPSAATATYAGLVARPSREDLVRTLAPYPAAERDVLDPLLGEAENAAVRSALQGRDDQHIRAAKRALFAAARVSDQSLFAVTDVSTTPLADIARHLVALTTIAVRDSIWLALDSGRIDGSSLWRELGRRAPGPYAAAPYFLCAWGQWRQGNGTLARIALDRSLDSDPHYAAARLLESALDSGLDPRRMPKLHNNTGASKATPARRPRGPRHTGAVNAKASGAVKATASSAVTAVASDVASDVA